MNRKIVDPSFRLKPKDLFVRRFLPQDVELQKLEKSNSSGGSRFVFNLKLKCQEAILQERLYAYS